MRTCFVHIGTHRTGTTSIQRILSRHAPDLRRHNYLYARTGRPSDAPNGHHNLAWEISGDRRFRAEYGTAADLFNEIGNWPYDVILSSEDFESSAYNGHGFDTFLRALRANEFTVRVIVYFRNQVDYAQSLYQILLLFDFPGSFREFLREVLDEGHCRWWDWTFPFCYRSLVTRLEALDFVTIDARSYDRAPGGSVRDFFSVLGLDTTALGIDSSVRDNGRPAPVDCVLRFCQNAKGAPLDSLEQRIIEGLYQSMGAVPLGIRESSRRRIADRFRESNQYLRDRYGVDLTGLEARVDSSEIEDGLSMEELFSAHLRRSIDRLTDLVRRERQRPLGEA
jgi:hypothetical protein